MRFVVSRSNLKGVTTIPGNKSATARAIVLGGLASGVSRARNPLPGLDSFSIVGMMRELGAKINTDDPKEWIFEGVDNRPNVPQDVLYAGNSGTGYYILTALCALIDGYSVITGDYQIRRRPAQPLIDALCDLGAEVISTRGKGVAPLIIKGPMKGGETKLPGINSQWLTPLLIAGALTERGVRVRVENLYERPYIDMTISWMAKAGVKAFNENYENFYVPGNQGYKAFEAEIPADWGSSGYPMIAAAITESKVTFVGMDPNDFAGERMFPKILREMGAKVEEKDDGRTITVEGGYELTGIEIDCSDTPDAVPILAVLGLRAKGKTVLRNVGASRLKETDRTRSIREELTKMGGRFEEREDMLIVYQSDLKGAVIDGRHDHRIVMASTVAGLVASGETIVTTAEYCKVSFPNFYEVMVSLGANIKAVED